MLSRFWRRHINSPKTGGKGDWKIVLAVVVISFISGLQHGVSPVLSDIAHHFSQVDVSLVQMLVTIPCLMAVCMALVTGWLALKLSQKTLFLVAAFVAGVMGFLPYLADSFPLLLVSRAVYGLSLGITVSLVTALVAKYFDGEARTRVMGIQAASVGGGVMIVTSIAGWLGSFGFRASYLVNIIGFIAFVVIAVCLPKEQKNHEERQKAKIQLNRKVFIMAVFIFIQAFFIIVYTTNISMHLVGKLAGDSQIAGMVTGIFAASQIVFGIVLGGIVKVTRNYTLPVSMFAMAVGYGILLLFPANLPMLIVGSICCGFAQGVYFPKTMVEVTNVVDENSVAMASAVLTCAMCAAQLIAPVTLNTAAKVLFGTVTTGHVMWIAIVGIACAGVCCTVWKTKDKTY